MEEFTDSLVSKLEFRGRHGQAVAPQDHRHGQDAVRFIVDGVEALEVDVETYEVEKPLWYENAEGEARWFIETLGFTSLKDTVLFPDEPELLETYDMSGSTMAQTHPEYPYILARYEKLRHIYKTAGEHLVSTVLVHEFAHDTSETDRIVVPDNPEFSLRYRSGFMLYGLGPARGIFSEEAFAHFVSGWYRRSLMSEDVSIIGITEHPSKHVPDYLDWSAAGAQVSGPDGYTAELLACGAERRGIMSANDFISTMLDTRTLGSRIPALRAYAQTVESIRPGLYGYLHNLQPSPQAWREAMDVVHDAVTSPHRYRQ